MLGSSLVELGLGGTMTGFFLRNWRRASSRVSIAKGEEAWKVQPLAPAK